MEQFKNSEQKNLIPIKQAEFKLKNQKDQTSTVRLLLMGEESVRIQVFLSRNCWEIILNQSQAQKIHKAFFLVNSAEELFSYIEDSINDKQVSIETVDSLTNLIFNQVFVNKPVVFKITLKQVEMNLQQIIQEISVEFEELQTKCEQMSTKYEDISAKCEDISKKSEEQHLEDQTKITQLQEELQKLKFHSNSNILQEDEKEMLYQWVSGGKVVSRLELLYKASIHGFQAQSFHLRCDGKGPLVCFVLSQNQRRFGGYIHLKFQKNLSADVAANPNDSFIFSLDDKKQYLSNDTNCSQVYYSASSYGFTMGGGRDLYLTDNCNSNCSSTSNLSSTYGKNQGGNNTSLAGSQSFLVSEIEVFQAVYTQ